jgi:hypothetical protein
MAKIALDRMTEDLSSAYILTGVREKENNDVLFNTTPFLGEDAEIGGRSADNLRFASGKRLVRKRHGKGGKSRVGYYVKKQEEKDGFFLYRSDTNESNEHKEESTPGLVLCDSLHTVNFAYLDDNGKLYDTWDSSVDPVKNRLPFMVLIELEFMNRSDPKSPLKFMTLVAIPSASILNAKHSLDLQLR